MKNVLLLVVSLVIVWIVWNLIKGLLFGVIGIAFQIALIALFCWAVYAVYKALNREKIM
jgi:membrane associated rhomboid family serine protease